MIKQDTLLRIELVRFRQGEYGFAEGCGHSRLEHRGPIRLPAYNHGVSLADCLPTRGLDVNDLVAALVTENHTQHLDAGFVVGDNVYSLHMGPPFAGSVWDDQGRNRLHGLS